MSQRKHYDQGRRTSVAKIPCVVVCETALRCLENYYLPRKYVSVKRKMDDNAEEKGNQYKYVFTDSLTHSFNDTSITSSFAIR